MSTASRLRYPRLRRVFFFLSGSRALPYSAGFFLLVIVIFAGLYVWLTPQGSGVKAGDEIPQDFNFYSGLYFSIVTISSLGYGDLRPVGISKVLASVEVILGISSIGVMIAALTSRQISHLVSRLFVSDSRKRLEEFATSYSDLEVQLERLLRNVSLTFAPTPGIRHHDIDTAVVPSEFRATSQALLAASTSVYQYFQDESVEGNFFDLVPVTSLQKLLQAIYDSLFILSQCLVNLPFPWEYEILSDVLRKPDRNNIMDSIESLKKTCAIGMENSRNQDIQNLFQRVDNACDSVSNIFFQVPQEELPDQIVHSSSIPQTPGLD